MMSKADLLRKRHSSFCIISLFRVPSYGIGEPRTNTFCIDYFNDQIFKDCRQQLRGISTHLCMNFLDTVCKSNDGLRDLTETNTRSDVQVVFIIKICTQCLKSTWSWWRHLLTSVLKNILHILNMQDHLSKEGLDSVCVHYSLMLLMRLTT